ncbi:hypothetical protein [Pedobacter arcticus]|uniref:hypothetical protein n=1 Tax=Pedobacter arcticus TaxID=752140 RepID=UPI0002D91432|nr:hypothetical protein [Pedobacter arcticus]
MLSYGVTKAEVGVYSNVDGTVAGWAEMDVYKDTFTLEEADPTKTEHFKQGEASPKLVRQKAAGLTIKFSLMDLSATNKVLWIGGTKTTVETVDTWHPPRVKTGLIKALRFTLEDGSIVTIPKTDCFTKANVKASDADINLMEVSGSILDPGFEDVFVMAWTDAPAV